MTVKTVVFSPEAEKQLAALFREIAADRSPLVAARYTEALVRYCEGLRQFPARGKARDDIRAGLRIIHYHRRVSVAYMMSGETLAILGVFYGGQDLEAALPELPS